MIHLFIINATVAIYNSIEKCSNVKVIISLILHAKNNME